MKVCLLIFFIPCCAVPLIAAAVPFTVTTPGANGITAEIVVQFNPATKSGYSWDPASTLTWYATSPGDIVRRSAEYLQEGIKRMTGKQLPIVQHAELTRGIILTLLSNAPLNLRRDPAILAALKNTGIDSYNDREAFYIRSEAGRTIVIANTTDGLAAAVAEMLESVGYEVLGMGPNWTCVPDFHQKTLTFSLEKAGRPGYYLRCLSPTSGQSYGVGTILNHVFMDPADENVDASYWRWQFGSRQVGKSMPQYPGHSLQAYHRPLIEKMRETRTTDGFLVPGVTIGLEANRPAATQGNLGDLWINDDAVGTPGAGKVYMSEGTYWRTCDLGEIGANIDLSVPMVREMILSDMKRLATAHFTANPDDLFIFCTEPEDGGGYAVLEKMLRYKNWYPDYLKAEGVPFGRPYVLHGYNGVNQPVEIWDPNSPSDTVFGFDNWLLREFDKWIKTLPPAQQVTSTGKRMTEQVRISGYSYNYHDVPPDFNLDQRIRLMIASYPKHRGAGKWKRFLSQQDMARAFQVMLPREPSGDYRIISLSYYLDPGVSGIPARWSASPESLVNDLHDSYKAGFKAINCEFDFNFGKYGLAYYLYSRLLWNPNLTVVQLDALRDRWLQRAFGSAWKEMKLYYDFMLTDHYPVNGPNSWAKAIRYIAAADIKLDAGVEPDAQRRLDDLKQFWYYYYLTESGKEKSPEMREFAWKGQMSYMTAMHVVTRSIFGTYEAKDVAGTELVKGPAHYTHAETQVWWDKILDFWKFTPVAQFADARLANGESAKSVDLNDLVQVKEFQDGMSDNIFLYNSGYMKPPQFFTVARKSGDRIGFKLSWPYNPDDGYYRQRDVTYGIDIWNPLNRKWEAFVDKTMVKQPSQERQMPDGKLIQEVDVDLKAPRAGTYRFDIGYGGNYAYLSSLGFDVTTGKYTSQQPFSYTGTVEGLTQSNAYFYIPRGTRSIDLEVWDNYKGKTLVLFKGGSPAMKPQESRRIEIGEQRTYVIPLLPGEDGTVAQILGNGFAFPFCYSIPFIWAKSPAALLVPRGVARADGLTIVDR